MTYKMNCGNISAGVPVFALMKNMIPDVQDGKFTVRAFSTNTSKMMYMTLTGGNGEAVVDGDTRVGGVPGARAEIIVDFRDQGGGFTDHTFPTGNLTVQPTIGAGPLAVTYKQLSFPRTARIICDGTVYIKNNRPPAQQAWREADDITAASFFLRGDDITVQR